MIVRLKIPKKISKKNRHNYKRRSTVITKTKTNYRGITNCTLIHETRGNDRSVCHGSSSLTCTADRVRPNAPGKDARLLTVTLLTIVSSRYVFDSYLMQGLLGYKFLDKVTPVSTFVS